MTQKLLLALICLFFSLSLTAQDSNLGNWYIYFGNKPIDSRWNWHHEVQYRNYNFIGDLEQLLLRTGIGYNLTENNNNLLLGYGFIHSENYPPNSNNQEEKIDLDEHRIYQQFITKQSMGRVSLQHRYRFEQRFLPDDFKLRFRYFLGINIPITNTTMSPNTLYFSAYNELFINGQNVIFDRNRLYGALGYTVSKNFRMELGVMSQIYAARNRPQLQIVVFNNLAGK